MQLKVMDIILIPGSSIVFFVITTKKLFDPATKTGEIMKKTWNQ